MELSVLDLACFVYRVSPDAILGATYSPDGGLSVVIDQGVRGAPKYSMTARETVEAIAREAQSRASKETQALRGVFSGTSVAPVQPEPTSSVQPEPAQTPKTHAPKPTNRRWAAKKGE